MNAAALLSLLLATGSVEPIGSHEAAASRVQVWLSDYEFSRGDRARAYVRSDEDGYLVVLHADAAGRVRVLFPLDPYGIEYVRGHETYEIFGRGEREAFLVDEPRGSGVVLAAWSHDPFRYDAFVRGDHWDYRTLAPEGVGADAESHLLDIAHWMADGRGFDYDVAHYIVASHAPVATAGYGGGYCPGCPSCLGWTRPSRFHVSIGYGSFRCPRATFGWGYYDPFYYYPIGYRPFLFCDPFFGCYPRARYRVAFYDPFWHHRKRSHTTVVVIAGRRLYDREQFWYGGKPSGDKRSVFRTPGSDGVGPSPRGFTTLAELGTTTRRGRDLSLDNARTSGARIERGSAVDAMLERFDTQRERRRIGSADGDAARGETPRRPPSAAERATRFVPREPGQSERSTTRPPTRVERASERIVPERATPPAERDAATVRPFVPNRRAEPETRRATPQRDAAPSVRPVTPTRRAEPAARPTAPTRREAPEARPTAPTRRETPATRPTAPTRRETPATRRSAPTREAPAARDTRPTRRSEQRAPTRNSEQRASPLSPRLPAARPAAPAARNPAVRSAPGARSQPAASRGARATTSRPAAARVAPRRSSNDE